MKIEQFNERWLIEQTKSTNNKRRKKAQKILQAHGIDYDANSEMRPDDQTPE